MYRITKVLEEAKRTYGGQMCTKLIETIRFTRVVMSFGLNLNLVTSIVAKIWTITFVWLEM